MSNERSGVTTRKAEYLSAAKAQQLARYRPERVICSLTNGILRKGRTRFVLIGRVLIISYHLMRLRLSPSVIHPDSFLAYVRGAKMVREYLRHVHHGATRDGIITEQLPSLPVAPPPYPEQLRILAEVERRVIASWHMRRILLRRRSTRCRTTCSVLACAFGGASHQIPAIKSE